MTITEALNIPVGMTFDEYEKLLKEKQKLEKQIAKASTDIDFENDSLEVLADEKGSERYNKHLQSKQKAEIKREKAQAKLKAIMERISK
jgi:cell division septum initiation protein DivIVA